MLSPAELSRLERVPLFAGLTPAARRVVASAGVVRRFAPGEALWGAGSDTRGLYVVLHGRVRVVRAPNGRQHAVHEEGPGGTLGEVPLFAGGRYPASAVAAEPTSCLVLDRAALARAVAADPELAFRLLGRLAERVRLLVDRLDRRTAHPVERRLAAFVLVRYHQARAAGHTSFALGATQAEAAEELGTVREVLVRALRALRAAGTIKTVARGRYEVVDERALRQLAEPTAPPAVRNRSSGGAPGR